MDCFYADMHCDTAYECLVQNKKLNKNNLHISLEKMKTFSKNIQVFAAWTSDKLDGIDRYDNFIKIYDYFLNEINENSDIIALCKNIGEIDNALASNKRAAVLGIEGGGALNGSLENIDKFYDMGVRIITLTWNGENELGYGAPLDLPLKEFGKKAVRRMNELNITVDVSHLCEKGFWNLCEITDKTFVASHSNSKVLCGHPRNLTDEQFKEIVRRGGVVGINLCPLFLVDGDYKGDKTTKEDICYHIEHFLELGGEKAVVFGADFDGVTELPKDIAGINDMASVPELLLKRNIKEETVKDIMFNNLYNYLKRSL